jgi:phage FluMu protein Com
MIALELKWALVLYSSVLGFMALFIWIYTEITVRRPHRYLGKQYLWRCAFCGYNYLDESDDELSRCPRCESYNSAAEEHARFVPSKGHAAGASSQKLVPATESKRNPSRRKRPHQRRRGPRKR